MKNKYAVTNCKTGDCVTDWLDKPEAKKRLNAFGRNEHYLMDMESLAEQNAERAMYGLAPIVPKMPVKNAHEKIAEFKRRARKWIFEAVELRRFGLPVGDRAFCLNAAAAARAKIAEIKRREAR